MNLDLTCEKSCTPLPNPTTQTPGLKHYCTNPSAWILLPELQGPNSAAKLLCPNPTPWGQYPNLTTQIPVPKPYYLNSNAWMIFAQTPAPKPYCSVWTLLPEPTCLNLSSETLLPDLQCLSPTELIPFIKPHYPCPSAQALLPELQCLNTTVQTLLPELQCPNLMPRPSYRIPTIQTLLPASQ